MGFFSSSKRIPFSRLDEILYRLPSLKSSEREYVRGLLSQYRSGGISQREIKRAVHEMKRNGGDHIGRSQANRIHAALLDALD